MISSLRGTVTHIGLTSAVIDVNGFGMLVNATPQTLARLRTGESATVATSMVVREDSMTLFGFPDAEHREVFETLLGVSGVGPRLALAVLAVHDPETVRVAAASGDDKAFSKVPGIGPKGARRIVLELADKLVPTGAAPAAAAPAGPVWQPQVLQALTGLGWSEKDATAALESATADESDVAARGNVAEIPRLTLRWLGQDTGRAPRAPGAGSRSSGARTTGARSGRATAASTPAAGDDATVSTTAADDAVGAVRG